MVLTRRETAAARELLALIDKGADLNSAVWQASKQGMLIDTARLAEIYDAIRRGIITLA